ALALAASGVGRRAWAASQPLRLASMEGLRRAEVQLGDQRCDFLTWEHLNWECAAAEHRVEDQTGLQRSAALRYAGEPRSLFHLATASGRSRRVRWKGVRLPARLSLTVAPADYADLGGTLELFVDGEPRGELLLDAARLQQWEVTLGAPRDGATLEFELRGSGAAVGVDAELPR
ncbi:MAG: hypothetical protein AAF447_04370, partial [Myxococcota bacterium]